MHLLTRVLFVLFCFVFNHTYPFPAKDMTFRLAIMTSYVVFTVRMLMFVVRCIVLMLPKPKPLWFHCNAGFCAREGKVAIFLAFQTLTPGLLPLYTKYPPYFKNTVYVQKKFLMFGFSLQFALWSWE